MGQVFKGRPDGADIPAPDIGSTAELIIGVEESVLRYAFINQQPITFFADLPAHERTAVSAGTLGVYSSDECELHIKRATFSQFSNERQIQWKTSIQNK